MEKERYSPETNTSKIAFGEEPYEDGNRWVYPFKGEGKLMGNVVYAQRGNKLEIQQITFLGMEEPEGAEGEVKEQFRQFISEKNKNLDVS